MIKRENLEPAVRKLVESESFNLEFEQAVKKELMRIQFHNLKSYSKEDMIKLLHNSFMSRKLFREKKIGKILSTKNASSEEIDACIYSYDTKMGAKINEWHYNVKVVAFNYLLEEFEIKNSFNTLKRTMNVLDMLIEANGNKLSAENEGYIMKVVDDYNKCLKLNYNNMNLYYKHCADLLSKFLTAEYLMYKKHTQLNLQKVCKYGSEEKEQG